MSSFKKVLISFLLINLFSCAPYSYFQVYDITADNEIKEKPIFEDSNVKVSYNFWGNMGNENFTVYNKTDSNIFIDLGLSHLIINNDAITYFKNREWSLSKTTTIGSSHGQSVYSYPYTYPISFSSNSTKSISKSSEYGTLYKEERIVIIPPRSQKRITGYMLNGTLFANCKVEKFPMNKKQISVINFDNKSTPLYYKNFITYSFDSKITNPIVFKNKFWVSKITFIPHNDFYMNKYDVNCGIKSNNITKKYKYIKDNRYYIEYKKYATFLNIGDDTVEKDQIIDDTNTTFNVGDKITYNNGLKTIHGEIFKIEKSSYYIKYKNKKGIEKTLSTTNEEWLKKIN